MALLQTRLQVLGFYLGWFLRDGESSGPETRTKLTHIITSRLTDEDLDICRKLIITQVSKGVFILTVDGELSTGIHRTFTCYFQYDSYLGHIKLPVSELRLERDDFTMMKISDFVSKTTGSDAPASNDPVGNDPLEGICFDYACNHGICSTRNIAYYWLNIFGNDIWKSLKPFDEQKFKEEKKKELDELKQKVNSTKLLSLKEETSLGEKYKALRPMRSMAVPLVEDLVAIESFTYLAELKNKQLVERKLDDETNLIKRRNFRGSPFGKSYGGIVI